MIFFFFKFFTDFQESNAHHEDLSMGQGADASTEQLHDSTLPTFDVDWNGIMGNVGDPQHGMYELLWNRFYQHAFITIAVQN